MQYYAAFHLVVHCLQNFHSGFPEYKGLINAINGFFSDHIKLIALVTRKPLLGTGKILDISA